MAANSTGVYQKDNGMWEYRLDDLADTHKITSLLHAMWKLQQLAAFASVSSLRGKANTLD